MLNTRRKKLITTGLMLAALTPLGLQAEENENVSDAIGPGDSDSKWVLGAYAGNASEVYAGEGDTGFITPNIEYRGEYFFVSDGDIGFNLFRYNGFSTGLLLTGEATVLIDEDDYDDNAELAGLEERDLTLDAGLYFQYTTDMGQAKLVMTDEVTGEHGGQSAYANYTFDLKYQGINLNPVVGVAWSSADTVNHLFGVSSAESTATRDAYKGHSAVSLFTGLRARYEITKNWDVDFETLYIRLGDGIKDSSIVDKDDVVVTALGFNYNF